MSCSTMASKSKGKCGQLPFTGSNEKGKGSAHVNKWCKASWYLKGTSGKAESEAIPRSWVSRTRGIVKWPPSHVNFKTAITLCMPPLEQDTWAVYVLISCTHSVNTLAEAQQLLTEMSDSESDGKAHDEDLGRYCSVKDGNETPHGRGLRTRTRNTKLAEYDSHVGDTTEDTEVESEAHRKEVLATRVIEGGLGDTSGSATQLKLAGKKLFSDDTQTQQSGKAKITTVAMKKMMPTNYQCTDPAASAASGQPDVMSQIVDEGHSSSQGVQGTVNIGLDSEHSDLDISETFTISAPPPPKRSAGLGQLASPSALGKSKNGAEISDTQMKMLLVELVAESKVRHYEVLDKLQKLERKMKSAAKKPRASEGAEGPEDDTQVEVTSDEDQDLEVQFCVELPVQTFEDFTRLEQELGESSSKRKALVSNYTEFVLNTFIGVEIG